MSTSTSPAYGTWASPISAELIAASTIRLGQTALRGDDIFWIEGRPQEQGRNVLVQRTPDGSQRDLTPPPFNVRTRAHEYGGGAFVLLAGGGAVFSHDGDQQLYRLEGEGAGAGIRQLTHATGQRYADAVHDAARDRLIAVCEDHREAGTEAVNTLVSIGLADGAVERLHGGHDFVSNPCLSPDGRQLAWLSWDHPNMPWDGTDLWLADLDAGGRLSEPRHVAGGLRESIFQPSWSPAGELHFVSDRSGWWNLYRLHDGAVQALHPMAAEFGRPQWAFGMSSYGFDGRGRIVCTFQQGGVSQLALLDTAVNAGSFRLIPTPFCAIDDLHVGSDFAVFNAGHPAQPGAVVRWDLTTMTDERPQAADLRRPPPEGVKGSGTATFPHALLRRAGDAEIAIEEVSRAEPISFLAEGGLRSHAFFYRPVNPRHPAAAVPADERPPLIVISHGGPTGATDAAFKWSVQYWTSRGFAVVDVNYGGSSGYGRAYRERLNGQWGIVDVADAICAARHLIDCGEADPERVAIRGGSAGGYTTLCALTFHRFFKAGASLYGIGDLETLATDTHKFESRYLDTLVGPYPAEQALYRARSPVHFTDRLAAPMILFQGADDKAVPPAQAQAMFDAVDAKGLPVALLMFEGEQHGFRRAATIRRVLEAELYFYGRVFGFAPADAIEPVDIRNLPAGR